MKRSKAYENGRFDGFKSLAYPNLMFTNPYFDRTKEELNKQDQDFDDYWEGFHESTDNGNRYYYGEEE